MALGTAVNELGAMLLRVLEYAIKQYERQKRARQGQEQIATEGPPPAADPDSRTQTPTPPRKGRTRNRPALLLFPPPGSRR